MEKIYNKSVGLWAVAADEGCVLHRKGSRDFTRNRRAIVADPEAWEDVAAGDVPRYSEAEYSRKVAELVHERYSVDDEIALINNVRDTDPSERRLGEYAEYQAYRAECKVRAKEELLKEWEAANAPEPLSQEPTDDKKD